MGVPGDRDTPRPGRPADFPEIDPSEDDTLDRTPPPTCVPTAPDIAARKRRAEVSTSPVPQPVKGAIEDLWHELAKHREGMQEVQRALDRLWGLRDAHDLAIANATTNAQLKAAVDALAIHGPGAEAAEEALACARELEIVLIGRDGTNGRFGTLSRDVQRDIGEVRKDVAAAAKDAATGRKRVNGFFAAAVGCLVASAGLIAASALGTSHHAGAIDNQVENNNRRLDRVERQLDRIPGALFTLPTHDASAGGHTP